MKTINGNSAVEAAPITIGKRVLEVLADASEAQAAEITIAIQKGRDLTGIDLRVVRVDYGRVEIFGEEFPIPRKRPESTASLAGVFRFLRNALEELENDDAKRTP